MAAHDGSYSERRPGRSAPGTGERPSSAVPRSIGNCLRILVAAQPLPLHRNVQQEIPGPIQPSLQRCGGLLPGHSPVHHGEPQAVHYKLSENRDHGGQVVVMALHGVRDGHCSWQNAASVPPHLPRAVRVDPPAFKDRLGECNQTSPSPREHVHHAEVYVFMEVSAATKLSSYCRIKPIFPSFKDAELSMVRQSASTRTEHTHVTLKY